jgi:cation diffusion facilitator family transporter
MDTKARQIRNVLIITLLLNWAVAVAKFIFGSKINSTSMIADSMHSFADSASNIIGLIGIRFAYQPQDKDHPYGHKKIETFASLGIAVLLILACVNIISMGIKRVIHPALIEITFASLAVMVFSLLVNVFVMNFEFRAGRRLQSDILISDSMHTRADIFTSLSVLFSFAAVKMGVVILDPLVALLISVFIAKAVIKIISDASKVLCDATVIDAKKIERICLKIPGVLKCHKIRTRGRPDDIHVDLHALVGKNSKLKDAHNLSSLIEAEIKRQIPAITDVVIHIEPFDGHRE